MIKQLINKLKIDNKLIYTIHSVHKTGNKIAHSVIWKATLHITYKYPTSRIEGGDHWPMMYIV